MVHFENAGPQYHASEQNQRLQRMALTITIGMGMVDGSNGDVDNDSGSDYSDGSDGAGDEGKMDGIKNGGNNNINGNSDGHGSGDNGDRDKGDGNDTKLQLWQCQ